MTKDEIAAVLERVRTWPAERQEDAVQMLLEMERQDQSIYVLTEEDRRAIAESRDQARRGEFASEEEIAALFARFRA
jgi:hypothetical protein